MRRLLGAFVFLLLLTGTAHAAGVGTLELTPEKGTSFHVRGSDSTQRLTLRNVGSKPTTGRLYAASATRTSDGGWSVGGAGSASWIGLADQTVSLQPGEKRVIAFAVRGSSARTGAVVVEQPVGTVVQRAATLVYVEPGRRVTLPRALVALAAVLVLAAAGGVLISRLSFWRRS